MNKKVIIIIILVVVVIGVVIGVVACGSTPETPDDGGNTVVECPYHLDEDGNSECDRCGEYYAVATPDPGHTADDVANIINNFVTSSIDLREFMKDRWVVNNVRLSHNPAPGEEPMKNVSINQIFFSDNLAHVLYESPHGDKNISEEYFVLNSSGYYVIQEGLSQNEYIFKHLDVPDLKPLEISTSQIEYNQWDGLYYISGDWTSYAFVYLLTRTNFLINFDEVRLDLSTLQNIIANSTMTMTVKIDPSTKTISELKLNSSLNKNGLISNVYTFTYTKTNGNTQITIYDQFEKNESIELNIENLEGTTYNIGYYKTIYNLAGHRTGSLQFTAMATKVKEPTIILQRDIEEQMYSCENIYNNYNNIIGSEYAYVSNENVECDVVYAYNPTYRCYLRYKFESENRYVFDGIRLFIDETTECIGSLQYSNLTIISHKKSEQWKELLIEKYAGLFYSQGTIDNGCHHIIVRDDEYNVDILMFKVGNAYQLIDFGKIFDENLCCFGTIDLSTRKIIVSNHAYNEKLYDKLLTTTFTVSGYRDGQCHSVAVIISDDEYLIFNIVDDQATFVKVQNMADGMCMGTISLDSNIIFINYHYNH